MFGDLVLLSVFVQAWPKNSLEQKKLTLSLWNTTVKLGYNEPVYNDQTDLIWLL